MKLLFLFSFVVWSAILHAQSPAQSLIVYEQNLSELRKLHVTKRILPDVKFFFFGMGDRKKIIYKEGSLIDAKTGVTLRQWIVKKETIVPSEYTAWLQTEKGNVIISEDEEGVFVEENGKRETLTKSKLQLPQFSDNKFGPILRVLHHEVLININNGLPLPNFLGYEKPWYRDAALMAMVLKETNNLDLIKNWILSIRDPFDRNNHGMSEADNPGEVLFLISLVADKNHPAVKAVLDSAQQFVNQHALEGKTDYATHSVFQTKWMKYGLKSLGLSDPYQIPKHYDSYSALFWWDFQDQHVQGPRFEKENSTNYPYLTWAEDHFYNEHNGILGDRNYPLTWEAHASDANYSKLAILDKQLVDQKICLTHTWHASEMFLYIFTSKKFNP